MKPAGRLSRFCSTLTTRRLRSTNATSCRVVRVVTRTMKLVSCFTSITVFSLAMFTLIYLMSPFAFDDESSGRTESLQDMRRSHLREACRRRNVSTTASCHPMTEFIYVDDDLRYVYCLVSKAACTSWKRTLLQLHSPDERDRFKSMGFGAVHNHASTDRYIRRWDLYPPEAMEERLMEYHKFIFVREPMERLVSVYRDKMLRDFWYKREHVPKIIERYRPKDSKPGRYREHQHSPVTFEEFVRYVVDLWHSGEPLDRHWRPQHQICCVCDIDYDFLGHYETLDSDARRLLDVLKAGDTESRLAEVNFPRTDPDNQHEQSLNLMTQFFANVSSELIDQLYRMYELEYELFGYERPRLKPT